MILYLSYSELCIRQQSQFYKEDRACLNVVWHKATPFGREIASLSSRPITVKKSPASLFKLRRADVEKIGLEPTTS